VSRDLFRVLSTDSEKAFRADLDDRPLGMGLV